jgi:hypothetical protein
VLPLLDGFFFSSLRTHDQRHRPVIDEADLHLRAEAAGLDFKLMFTAQERRHALAEFVP